MKIKPKKTRMHSKIKSLSKTLLWSFACLLILGILLSDAGTPTLDEEHGCTMILVGKEASADGSVMMAYNNDWDGRGASHVVVVPRKRHKPGAVRRLSNGVEIPQAEVTYAYIGNELQWTGEATFENGINEFQVAVCFGTAVKVNDKVKQVDPLLEESDPPGILIPWRLVLERSKTAREGVELVEKLFNKYGLREDGSFAIADPDEVWLFQIGGGHHWAAMKIPDQCYVIQDNTFRMGEIDCQQKSKVKCSPVLIEFSIENDLYDPQEGPFSFKKSWGYIYTKTPPRDRRIWRVQSLLSPSSSLPPDTPYMDFPLFLTPDKKITKEKLMSLLRDHHEGTEYDLTGGYKKGNPHFTEERTLCRTNTQYGVVTQLRRWLPNPIGGVFWLAVANPDTSVYIPWYQGIADVPQVYRFGNSTCDQESAYWTFKRIGNLVNTHYGDLIEDARSTWRVLEEEQFAIQESVEKTAVELFEQDETLVREFLTGYSNAQAVKAYTTAREMINELQTKLVKLHFRKIEK
ncbi:MAG: C69 family dipeptidase [Candidatus Aminicenantes bacterium]